MDKKASRTSILKRKSLNQTSANESIAETTTPKDARRVSFASSNFVKPFAADPEKNTIWDNTYEEEVNHTDSTKSSENTDSKFFGMSSVTSIDMQEIFEQREVIKPSFGILKSSKKSITIIKQIEETNKENCIPINVFQKQKDTINEESFLDLTLRVFNLDASLEETCVQEDMQLTLQNKLTIAIPQNMDKMDDNMQFTCTNMSTDILEPKCKQFVLEKMSKGGVDTESQNEDEDMQFTCTNVPIHLLEQQNRQIQKTIDESCLDPQNVDEDQTEISMQLTCTNVPIHLIEHNISEKNKSITNKKKITNDSYFNPQSFYEDQMETCMQLTCSNVSVPSLKNIQFVSESNESKDNVKKTVDASCFNPQYIYQDHDLDTSMQFTCTDVPVHLLDQNRHVPDCLLKKNKQFVSESNKSSVNVKKTVDVSCFNPQNIYQDQDLDTSMQFTCTDVPVHLLEQNRHVPDHSIKKNIQFVSESNKSSGNAKKTVDVSCFNPQNIYQDQDMETSMQFTCTDVPVHLLEQNRHVPDHSLKKNIHFVSESNKSSGNVKKTGDVSCFNPQNIYQDQDLDTSIQFTCTDVPVHLLKQNRHVPDHSIKKNVQFVSESNKSSGNVKKTVDVSCFNPQNIYQDQDMETSMQFTCTDVPVHLLEQNRHVPDHSLKKNVQFVSESNKSSGNVKKTVDVSCFNPQNIYQDQDLDTSMQFTCTDAPVHLSEQNRHVPDHSLKKNINVVSESNKSSGNVKKTVDVSCFNPQNIYQDQDLDTSMQFTCTDVPVTENKSILNQQHSSGDAAKIVRLIENPLKISESQYKQFICTNEPIYQGNRQFVSDNDATNRKTLLNQQNPSKDDTKIVNPPSNDQNRNAHIKILEQTKISDVYKNPGHAQITCSYPNQPILTKNDPILETNLPLVQQTGTKPNVSFPKIQKGSIFPECGNSTQTSDPRIGPESTKKNSSMKIKNCSINKTYLIEKEKLEQTYTLPKEKKTLLDQDDFCLQSESESFVEKGKSLKIPKCLGIDNTPGTSFALILSDSLPEEVAGKPIFTANAKEIISNSEKQDEVLKKSAGNISEQNTLHQQEDASFCTDLLAQNLSISLLDEESMIIVEPPIQFQTPRLPPNLLDNDDLDEIAETIMTSLENSVDDSFLQEYEDMLKSRRKTYCVPPSSTKLSEKVEDSNKRIKDFLANFKMGKLDIVDLEEQDKLENELNESISSQFSEETISNIPEEEEIPMPLTLEEKIRELEKRCGKYWEFVRFQDDHYCFYTFYRAVPFRVYLHENYLIKDIETYINLIQNPLPTTLYLSKCMIEKLKMEHLMQALGKHIDLLTLLDYLCICMEELMNFDMEFDELEKEFGQTHKFRMNPDLSITIEILSIRFILWWTITVDLSFQNVGWIDSVNSVKATYNTQVDEPVNEEDIKKLAEDVLGPRFIYNFAKKVNEYVIVAGTKIKARRDEEYKTRFRLF